MSSLTSLCTERGSRPPESCLLSSLLQVNLLLVNFCHVVHGEPRRRSTNYFTTCFWGVTTAGNEHGLPPDLNPLMKRQICVLDGK